jgi:hypothetical protein
MLMSQWNGLSQPGRPNACQGQVQLSVEFEILEKELTVEEALDQYSWMILIPVLMVATERLYLKKLYRVKMDANVQLETRAMILHF